MRRKNLLDPDEILVDSVSAINSQYHSEWKLERPISGIYYAIFFVLIGAGVFYLGSRAGLLQVTEGNDFLVRSQENRFLTRPIFPPRGAIYDGSKKILVENHPSFGLLLDTKDFNSSGEKIKDLAVDFKEVLGYEPEGLSDYLEKDNSSGVLSRQPVVMQNIAPDKVVSIVSRFASVAGLHIFESFRRFYKDNYAYSHVLGFVGTVSEEDLAGSEFLKSGDTIGKSGIEAYYDKILRGTPGKKIVEIDVNGSETRFKLVKEPEPGRDVLLTLDGDLQSFIYKTIENYTAGTKGASAVAIDPRNGEVRALISFPGFDSNKFGHSLSSQEFDAVLKNNLKPLFNRALSGEFPSGSSIKPVFASAALEEEIIDPGKKIFDGGYIEIPNPYKPGEFSRFVDWKIDGHGWVNMYDAIAYSVNVYFYTIGGGFKEQRGLGIENLKKYAERFGLGSILGIDLPGEKSGLFPDQEWKKIAEPENPDWRIGDTYNVSIGQGGIRVTPLQMAVATAAIANGGKLYRPYLLDSILDQKGEVVEKKTPQVLRNEVVSEEVLKEVRKGMRQTVTEGTARLLAGLPVSAGAKTGTAQAGSGLPHAWVTVFAPYENPEIALVVMVEHAGEGSTVAVPITYEILKWYFENRR